MFVMLGEVRLNARDRERTAAVQVRIPGHRPPVQCQFPRPFGLRRGGDDAVRRPTDGPANCEGCYRTLIAVTGEQLTAAGVDLHAGLPATVNITTHRRTVFDHPFQPLGDFFSGAMREE